MNGDTTAIVTLDLLIIYVGAFVIHRLGRYYHWL